MTKKRNNIVWRNNLESTFSLLVLCIIDFIWSIGKMNNTFRSLIMALFPITIGITIWANYKAVKNEVVEKKNAIKIVIFQVIFMLLGAYISLFINKSNKGDFWYGLIVWILIFALILFLIIPRIIDYVDYATVDYYKQLRKLNYKTIFSLKVRYIKIKNIAQEIKNIIIGLYALLVGSMISFGVDIFEISFNPSTHLSITTTVDVSESVWGVAMMILGVLIFFQFVSGHFEAIAKQHIEIINNFVNITDEEKNYITSI